MNKERELRERKFRLSGTYFVPVTTLSGTYFVPVTTLSGTYFVPVTTLSGTYFVPVTTLNNTIIMRNVITVILLLIIGMGNIKAEEQRTAYCELMAWNFWGAGKVYITIDLGQEHTGTICDSQNKPVKFNSYIDALNYMATLGWKVKDTYFLPETKQQVLHFLLEKTVATDAQIREGIYVKPPKEKVPYKPGQTGDDMY